MDAWKTSGSSPGQQEENHPARTLIDFSLENHGSIFLLRPITASAFEWVSEHIPEDAQFFGNAVVVEHRYVEAVIDGITADGLGVA